MIDFRCTACNTSMVPVDVDTAANIDRLTAQVATVTKQREEYANLLGHWKGKHQQLQEQVANLDELMTEREMELVETRARLDGAIEDNVKLQQELAVVVEQRDEAISSETHAAWVEVKQERDEARKAADVQAAEIARLNRVLTKETERAMKAEGENYAALGRAVKAERLARVDAEAITSGAPAGESRERVARQRAEERVQVLETALRLCREYVPVATTASLRLDAALTPVPTTHPAAGCGNIEDCSVHGAVPAETPATRTLLRTNGDSEMCANCERHIRNHYGGTEYRCDPKDEVPAPTRNTSTPEARSPAVAKAMAAFNKRYADLHGVMPAQEEIDRLRAELGDWQHRYFLVADAVAAESESAEQLADIARATRTKLVGETKRADRERQYHLEASTMYAEEKAAHAATTAKLGRAVALVDVLANHLELAADVIKVSDVLEDDEEDTEVREVIVEARAILADAESTRAGEACREMETAVHEARGLRWAHPSDRARYEASFDNALAKVNARRLPSRTCPKCDWVIAIGESDDEHDCDTRRGGGW